jgi:hypothetical protein
MRPRVNCDRLWVCLDREASGKASHPCGNNAAPSQLQFLHSRISRHAICNRENRFYRFAEQKAGMLSGRSSLFSSEERKEGLRFTS